MKLEPQIRALLSRPNFAHLSTLMPDGSPNNSPVWIDVQDDRILISSGRAASRSETCYAIPASQSRLSISMIRTKSSKSVAER